MRELSGFISRRVGKVRLLTVATPGYLESAGKPIAPKDLQGHRCIPESGSSRAQLWRFASRSKAQSTVHIGGSVSASTGHMVKELCLQGLGIAQLPDFMVSADVDRGELVEILPQHALDNFFIHMLYHQNATGNIALKAVVQHLVSSLEETL